MKNRITTLVVAFVAVTVFLAGTALAQKSLLPKNVPSGAITDSTKAGMITKKPKTNEPPIVEHYIEYLAANPDNDEIVTLTLDVNGKVEYSHTRGGNPLINRDAINIQVKDQLSPETIQLAFGVMAAGGFMRLPSQFPAGGTYKADFDIWMTVETPTDSNTVFADAEALVTPEFDTIREVLHTLSQAIENKILLDLEIYDTDGTLAGGIQVQNDGDAVLRRLAQDPDTVGVRFFNRHLSNVKMMQIEQALDSAAFFTLPTCSGVFESGTFADPFEFSLAYRKNGVQNAIYFGSGSEAAESLAFIVDWGLDLVR